MKWLFTIKFDKDGNEIAKARLVAIGCQYTTHYNIKETYSPECPIEIVRSVRFCH